MLIIPTEKSFDWNRAPIALSLLVLVNCLVFLLYQTGDDAKIATAINTYNQYGLLEEEAPLYEDYLLANDDSETLDAFRELRSTGIQELLIQLILNDDDFYQHLVSNQDEFFKYDALYYWQDARGHVNKLLKSISYMQLGLVPNDISVLTIFSHQFLHGGVMHLVGNMFFLLIFGFAVEAAVGHLRFTAFYILSGVGGGLLFAVIDPTSTIPLVGASGAISGVMAMYLAAFRLKKIEFFYWFFVFVGYIRAPALLILPFYIGKEVFDFLTNEGSNVAYMAHVGGLITGAALILGALALNRSMFDEEYIEADQSVDPKQKKLAEIYAHIDAYRFPSALKGLNRYIAENGSDFELAKLRYDLMKSRRYKGYDDCVKSLLLSKTYHPNETQMISEVWSENPEMQEKLDVSSQIKLGISLSTPKTCYTAESIFRRLHEQELSEMSLGVLANRLSAAFEKLGNRDKKNEYAAIADIYINGAAR